MDKSTPIIIWALAGMVLLTSSALGDEAKREMRFDVKGLCCSTCAVAATGSLRQIEGVEHIAFDFSKRSGAVRYSGDVPEKTIFKAIVQAGLQIVPDERADREDAPVRVAGLCRLCQNLLADPANAAKVIAAFEKEFRKGRATVSFDATIIEALSSAEAFFASLDDDVLKRFQCRSEAIACPTGKACSEEKKDSDHDNPLQTGQDCR